MRVARILQRGSTTAATAFVDDPAGASVRVGDRALEPSEFAWAPPCDGLVYGVALNDRQSLERLGRALHEPPYQAPPQAPVLYIKPYNTHVGHGARVQLPRGADAVVVAATLGIVIGSDAARVPERRALDHVRGYTVAADLSLPQASYYRPAIREQCFDGACPIGPWMVSPDALDDPHTAPIRTYAGGALLAERTLADAVRRIPRLIADITEFMTLKAGDVLLCGVPYGAPVVTPGATGVAIEVDVAGAGRLGFTVGSGAREAAA